MNPWELLKRGVINFKNWCLSEQLTLRDKLLATVGTMAILWYFMSIIVVGFSDARIPTTNPPADLKNGATAKPPEPPADLDQRKVRRIKINIPLISRILPKEGFPEDLISFMAISITTISGTLATYLGLVLGLSQARDQARAAMAVRGVANNQPDDKITLMQSAAAWSYVFSLVIALVFWALKVEDLNDVVVNLGRSILGLFGGVLAVILNVPNTPPR